jgi:anti-sigma B factor antagonist
VDDDTGPLHPDEMISVMDRPDNDRSVVVAVFGEIDLMTAPMLGAALTRALGAAGPGPVVVLDLTRVIYIGAVGISALVQANSLACQHNQRLRLVVDRACPAVTRPLAVTGTQVLIDTYGDLDSAVRDWP